MSLLRWDVAVVGGGVVGLAAVAALREQGFQAGLIEQGAAPLPPTVDELRVYAIAPAAAPLLPAEALRGGEVQAYTGMQVWHDDPARGLRFTAAGAGVAQLGWIAAEPRLRHALAQQVPATVQIYGTSIVQVTEHDDGLSLSLSDDRVVRCRLALACDGAASSQRQQLQIPVRQWGYDQQGLVATVVPERAHESACRQRFLPDSVLALLPLADGRCSIVWSTPQAAELAAMAPESFEMALTEASQGVLGRLRLDSARVAFPLQALQAERYVQGRWVLLGDAAHVVHPLAGQGVNLGLGDAAALADVLATARDAGRDWTSPRVLARYERARQAAAQEMIVLTDALARGFRLPGVAELMGWGLQVLEQLPLAKTALMRRAIGH